MGCFSLTFSQSVGEVDRVAQEDARVMETSHHRVDDPVLVRHHLSARSMKLISSTSGSRNPNKL